MAIKLYNLAQLVKLNTNPVTVTSTDGSQQRIKLYQGQPCSVSFSVFNSTNKPLSVAGTQLVFKIWTVDTNILLLSKTVEAIKNDVVTVSFDSNDLQDIDEGYYHYTCNIITGEEDNLILYMDTALEHRGFLEVVVGASNYVIPTTELTAFSLLGGVYYSSSVNNVDNLRQRGRLHTYTATSDSFTGTITAQATMVQAGYATTQSDWVDADTVTVSDYTGNSYGTFTGVYSQVRFVYEPAVGNTGSVTKVLYRS